MATATTNARTVQASATNSAAGTTTSSAVDHTTALGTLLTAEITNGTAPTIGCSFHVEISNDNSDWMRVSSQTAGVTASTTYTFSYFVPAGARYYRTVFTGNTGQSVTVECDGNELTSIG